jgi:hypothetical protein
MNQGMRDEKEKLLSFYSSLIPWLLPSLKVSGAFRMSTITIDGRCVASALADRAAIVVVISYRTATGRMLARLSFFVVSHRASP